MKKLSIDFHPPRDEATDTAFSLRFFHCSLCKLHVAISVVVAEYVTTFICNTKAATILWFAGLVSNVHVGKVAVWLPFHAMISVVKVAPQVTVAISSRRTRGTPMPVISFRSSITFSSRMSYWTLKSIITFRSSTTFRTWRSSNASLYNTIDLWTKNILLF